MLYGYGHLYYSVKTQSHYLWVFKKKKPTLLAGNAELKSAVMKLLNGIDVIYGL